ncbi:hypothetical protein H6G41_08900 [Tolypothrix sp. FACHB-123]|uniref:hypothetical protein n=1 Tax=Tolypothrix sp. FACHB-123 TaxID=2692868 RepID=UPI001687CCC0|nr:hypothetical protein [Tolypothrix sp. FACHB-123]MBD2354745.1 hypothetical protein [Tolypothrix sp. FACHB-123]
MAINNVLIGESNNKFDTCTNDDKNLVANIKTEILKANAERKYAAFINNSSVDITLILGTADRGAINKGIILKPRGSYEVNSQNLYLGAVFAVSAFAAKLTFVECVE